MRETIERGFWVGGGFLYLASKISSDRNGKSKAYALATFGSSLQTISVGIASALCKRIEEEYVGVTGRAVQSFDIDPPFDRKTYLLGLKMVHDNVHSAYNTMYRALSDDSRNAFAMLQKVLEEDPNMFSGVVNYLHNEVRRQAEKSPALSEFVRETIGTVTLERPASDTTVMDVFQRTLSWLQGESDEEGETRSPTNTSGPRPYSDRPSTRGRKMVPRAQGRTTTSHRKLEYPRQRQTSLRTPETFNDSDSSERSFDLMAAFWEMIRGLYEGLSSWSSENGYQRYKCGGDRSSR
ncbi:hypothetical protein [Methanopyrus sp. KOL6]|uniref:hypothetical protein n=1 Tax=Methanopyrus sp. KOL6 TaxID=1937004 RepID=UPI000B4B4EFA|nr:hypothetical protein [Methanopyrus sp. KOL6]